MQTYKNIYTGKNLLYIINFDFTLKHIVVRIKYAGVSNINIMHEIEGCK